MEKIADIDLEALTAGNIMVPQTQQIITQAVYDSPNASPKTYIMNLK